MKHKITPEIRAHINALIAWNGKTKEEAEAFVDELYDKFNNDSTAVYFELDKQSYANSSIMTAMKSIEKYSEELKKNPYDTVIKILSEIHDQWVVDNDKKYNRDAGNIDRRLYQHLPLELIGEKEAASDLLFLAPFLEEMGIKVGTMGQYSYISSPEIVEAYNKAVERLEKQRQQHLKQVQADHGQQRQHQQVAHKGNSHQNFQHPGQLLHGGPLHGTPLLWGYPTTSFIVCQ